MSRTYKNYLLEPLRNWGDIPWKYFGYSYAGTFGSVLLFPVVYLGLLMIGFIERRTGKEFEKGDKISSAVHLSILLLILMSIPIMFLASSVFFFVLGYYLDGYLLVGVGLLWLTGLSVAMPALIYLLVENRGWGWFKILEIYKIGGLTNDAYRRLSVVMLMINFILFVGGTLLLITGVGAIAIPLLVLWYCYICADVYEEMNDVFGIDPEEIDFEQED